MNIRNQKVYSGALDGTGYEAVITLKANVNRPVFIGRLQSMPGIKSAALL